MPGEGRDKYRSGGRRIISLLTVLAASLLIVFCDQLTKSIVQSRLSLGSSIPLLKGLLHITLVYNKGAAFGIFRERPLLFIAIGSFAALLMLILMPRILEKGILTRISFSLVFGGVLGNLVDRIRFGHVVDFIDLRVWPVFNIADSAITCGIAIIIIKTLLEKREPPAFGE